MSQPGPRSLALQLQEARVARRKTAEPLVEVTPTWKTKHVMHWLQKGRTSFAWLGAS